MVVTRILADFEAAGVVGEATNKLVGYLAAVSRKLDRPLAVVIQSSSAAGKSSLMDAVLAIKTSEVPADIEAATEALAQGTEAFAAARMNDGIRKALAGKHIGAMS
jgi:hypothetical protein